MASRKEHITTNKEVRSLEPYEVKEKINRLEHPKDKALLSFLYLTGCRIEEVVKFVQEARPNRTVYTKIEGKRRKTQAPLRRALIGLPLKRNQVEIFDNYIIIKGVRCLKRRAQNNSIRRTIPIVRNEKEEFFVNTFLEFIKDLGEEDFIWCITRSRAYQILDKIGVFPHLLRHTRATILATDYGFTDVQMQRFFGWADTRQTARYTHLSVQDILFKMQQTK